MRAWLGEAPAPRRAPATGRRTIALARRSLADGTLARHAHTIDIGYIPTQLLMEVSRVQFGLIGAGYWTERYFMVARELPQRFRKFVSGPACIVVPAMVPFFCSD